DVEPAIGLDRGAYECLVVGLARRIDPQRYRLAPSLDYQVAGLVGGRLVQVGDDDACAFLGEGECRGTADPGSGAGDDPYLALQLTSHRSLSSIYLVTRQSLPRLGARTSSSR